MNDLEKVISIVEDIQNHSGKNDKINIIRTNKNNTLFVEVLKFLLDPAVVTGIAKTKYDKCKLKTREFFFDDPTTTEGYLWLMNRIRKNNSGRETDIATIKWFVNDLSDREKDFTRALFTKTLKIGADAKSVNKAIPGTIVLWEVQQAYPISDKNRPKPNTWFSLSQKLNGNNCGYLDGKLISRQGKEFKGLDHIVKAIESLPFKNMFFNGELIRKNTDNLPDDENFQIGTGIINSDDENKTCIKFVIYEMLPKKEFLDGKSVLPYKSRKTTYLEPLKKAIADLGTDDLEVVTMVYEGTDQSVIQRLLDEADVKGWEGLMLNKNTLWENKRNNGILKVKTFHSADVICKSVVEGDGKFAGTLGNIVCDYKGFDLGVGSGFTDEQRRLYWEHPELIVGKVVAVKYKVETKNKDGGVSLQFPTFTEVREDGKAVNYES